MGLTLFVFVSKANLQNRIYVASQNHVLTTSLAKIIDKRERPEYLAAISLFISASEVPCLYGLTNFNAAVWFL